MPFQRGSGLFEKGLELPMPDVAMEHIAVLGDDLRIQPLGKRANCVGVAQPKLDEIRVLFVRLVHLFGVRLAVVSNHPGVAVFLAGLEASSPGDELGCLFEILRQRQPSQPLGLVTFCGRVEPR